MDDISTASDTRERIRKLIREKPEHFDREVFGGDWQCPYCGSAGAENVTDDNRIEKIEAHLNACLRAKGLEGNISMRPPSITWSRV